MRTVIPWQSRLFSELDNMQGIVGKVFSQDRSDHFLPSMNVLEKEDGFEVSLDIPGISPKDVSIEVHEGRLTVSGKREFDHDDAESAYHRIERRRGEFERSLQLPQDVDEDNIAAEYVDGVLTLRLPKCEQAQPRQIPVETRTNH